MVSPKSAQAPVEKVTDLGKARRARSDKKTTQETTAVSKAAQEKDSSDDQVADAAQSKEPVKSKTARRKPGNRRFDKEKVEHLKALIADGSYKINPERIADKFIEHERN